MVNINLPGVYHVCRAVIQATRERFPAAQD